MRFLRIVSSLLLIVASLAVVVNTLGQAPSDQNKNETPTAAPLTITTTDLPKGKIDSDYTGKLNASGVSGTVAWSVTEGNLPDGLDWKSKSENPAFIIGKPKNPGNFSFTVQVTDKNNKPATQAFKIVINSDISISTDTLQDGKVGSDYSAQLSATGAAGKLKWELTTGALPDGLKLTSTGGNAGAITGTPRNLGTFTFTAEVTDESNTSATRVLRIVVAPQFGFPIASLLCCETKTGVSGTAPSTTEKSTINPGEVALILLVGLSYWLGMVVVRWHRVARPSREFLRAKIGGGLAELSLMPPRSFAKVPDERDQIRALLQQAGLAIAPKVAGRNDWYRLSNFLLWSRGEEMAAWTYLHSAEIQMVDLMPAATVTTRLEASEPQLRTLGDACSIVLANNIQDAQRHESHH